MKIFPYIKFFKVTLNKNVNFRRLNPFVFNFNKKLFSDQLDFKIEAKYEELDQKPTIYNNNNLFDSITTKYFNTKDLTLFRYLRKSYFLSKNLENQLLSLTDNLSLKDEEIIEKNLNLKNIENEIERIRNQIYLLKKESNQYISLIDYLQEIKNCEDLMEEAKNLGENSLIKSLEKEIKQYVNEILKNKDEILEDLIEEDEVFILFRLTS